MSYRVVVVPAAEKQLLSIDKPMLMRLRKAIDTLGEDPRRVGVIALAWATTGSFMTSRIPASVRGQYHGNSRSFSVHSA